MSIQIFTGRKFVQKKYQTSEELMVAYNLEKIADREDLDKWLNKGNTAYVYIVPFHSNLKDRLDDKDIMYWTKTMGETIKAYNQSAEEV